MSNLLNQSAAHKLAKSVGIRLGASGINALNTRIEELIKEAATRSRKNHRKTILERDIRKDPDLFS